MTDQKDSVSKFRAANPLGGVNIQEPSDPDTLLAGGFEEAFVGYGTRFTHGVAVYSKRKCLEVLVERDEMSRDEALEFFDFNVSGAYVGENTPVFLEDLDVS